MPFKPIKNCKQVDFLINNIFLFQFFERKGVPEIYTAEKLFQYITGYDFSDKMALLDLQLAFKMKPHLIDKPGMELEDKFDTNWEKVRAGEVPIVEKIIPEIDVALVEPIQA